MEYNTRALGGIRLGTHCFEVATSTGRMERVALHRYDIAEGLAAGELHAGRGVPRKPENPRQPAALARARVAVDAARGALAPTAPAAAPRSFTPAQQRIADKMPRGQLLLLETVGAVVGREFAKRDRRLSALEARLPARGVGEGEERARLRACSALNRARAALARTA